ncbi:MAG TPA: lamin tail domain-containing protein, partial [Herpetosiphonaceae bacterium]
MKRFSHFGGWMVVASLALVGAILLSLSTGALAAPSSNAGARPAADRSSQLFDDEPAGSSPRSLVSTTIVISEFRTRGPSGAADEFVELYNLSGSSVNIGGWKLNGSNSGGSISTRATVPANTTLSTGCRYLFTNATASGGYSGSVAGNATYMTSFTDDGGLAILDSSNGIIDAVGMSTGSAYKEGTTLTQMAGTTNQSYERKPLGSNGTDTDNNSADFTLNAGTSNPQNTSSTCGSTPTATPVTPTATATITPTATPVTPTATATITPTNTPTNTPVTPTATNTPVPPTDTPTNT